MQVIFCILIGYVIGCINPSYLLGRIKGFDIRKTGSGNAGASNAMITLGKAAGAFSAVFDIAKAFFAVLLAGHLFPAFAYAKEVTGACCILGHIFPFYMKFKGGKGLATLGGVVLSFNWIVLLCMLAGEIVLALIVNYICVVPITACIIFPIVYGIMTKKWIGVIIYLIPAVFMLWKHRENLVRIKEGRELRLSYLWNRQAEVERLEGIYDEKDYKL